MSPIRSAGDHSAQDPQPAETVRYRLTPVQRVVPFLAGGFLASAIVQILLFQAGHPLFDKEALSIVPVVVGVPFMGLLISREFGISLTDHELVIHSSRRRAVRWSDIESIRTEGSTIALYERDGRRTALRAPTRTLDRRFEEKFRVIETWWTDHRTW